MATRQYIGARYVPIFADPVEWTDDLAYEHLMMVQHEGETYISQQAVPIGIQLPDTEHGEESNEYWVHMSNWNAQVESYRQEVLQYNGRISTLEDDLPIASFDSTNTVKKAIDDINDILPSTSFNTNNTVKDELETRIFGFETIVDMENSTQLFDGAICYILGSTTAGDSKANVYYVTDTYDADYVALANDLYAYAVEGNYLFPDLFEGSDSDKINACLELLEDNGGTILLNREYNITGHITIEHRTNVAKDYIRFIGVNKNAGFNMNEYAFKGAAIGNWDCGGIVFNNITFRGTDTLFDTAYLIKIYLDNCVVKNFSRVFDNSLTYMSNYHITNTQFWDVSGAVFNMERECFDVSVTNSQAVYCSKFLYHDCTIATITAENDRLQKFVIDNCCIEECTNTPITLGRCVSTSIINNYFENTTSNLDIDLSNAGDSIGLVIRGNNTLRQNGQVFIKIPATTPYGLIGEISYNAQRGTGSMFDYAADSSDLKINIIGNYTPAANQSTRTIRSNDLTAPNMWYEFYNKKIDHTFTANTWERISNADNSEYLEFNVPANSLFKVIVAQDYSASEPAGLGLARGTARYNMAVESSGGNLEYIGANTSDATTLYFSVFGKASGSGVNGVQCIVYYCPMENIKR